jgi:hypothetical protein
MMARLLGEIAISVAGFAVATAALVITGCADEAGQEPELPVATRSAAYAKAPESPPEKQFLDGQEFRLQKKRDWWNHAREVLFTNIELSAEQARGVAAIIDEQLDKRARLQQRDAEIRAARTARDPKRTDAARRAARLIQAQIKKPHEIYEEMRALLTEEQRPTFDMNRARHVAESQAPPKAA